MSHQALDSNPQSGEKLEELVPLGDERLNENWKMKENAGIK